MSALAWTHPAMARAADQLRTTIARRRDALVVRQRRGWSAARAALINQLGDDYRTALTQALQAGIEAGP